MTSLADAIAEDRRIIILRALQEAQGSQLNETILQFSVNKFGNFSGRDVVRAEMVWLEEHRLVRLERLPSGGEEFWVAHLTTHGDEVARGRHYPGVARRII